MPEQPQWSERTLDMPPQDPWAEPPTQPAPAVPRSGEPTRVQTPNHPPTRVQAPDHQHTQVQTPHAPTSPAPQNAPQSPFSQGRAQVTPRTPQQHDNTAQHEPTGTGWPGAGAPRTQHSLGWHVRQLRRGGEWSTAAVLFTFVCWGIWALSGGGSLTTPVVVFVVTLLVAAGVFALARLVGRTVLERQMGRTRHTARGSHMVVGVFLVGAGFTFLQQTAWVMDAVNWVKSLFV
ncbi:DNA-directed RNA polymerase II [Actinoplanes palleronii]|uniref:Uncharacterized protein n=1 Tax=Actinoplanes palleronii TaxID=113570 RepID=A0ABQ4BS01_9ACTN|nr:DNA-directed RNA polymerase II [Actinoplanes palleronii]GIE73464.1 hypothetical protein Apa02nite_095720 [Actinoplanes palleronii]